MDWKLEVITVPVSDVERAKTFYTEGCGFTLDVDHEGGGIRVVQVTPPGSACSVVVGPIAAGPDSGPVKGLQLVVADVEAARAELAGRGVEVSPVRHVGENGWADGHGGPWNAFVFFDDPDGNSWTVQERPVAT